MSLVIQDSVPSSTFWLVACFLLVGILVVFDLINKVREEVVDIDKTYKNVNSHITMELNLVFRRLDELEKCKASMCVKPPPKVEKVKTPPAEALASKKVDENESESSDSE